MLGIQTGGTSWEHKLEEYLKKLAEGLNEGLWKNTIVTGVLWVGQICIGSATGTDSLAGPLAIPIPNPLAGPSVSPLAYSFSAVGGHFAPVSLCL